MMYHALFDMEDFHGLHPVKREDGYYLEFSGHTALDQRITKFTFKEFLEKWGSITKLVGFRIPDIVPPAHVK